MVHLSMENSISRQWIRKTLIILSFVLLPATFVYISCPIITQGASEGIVTGGLIVFILLFTSSLFLGRIWCGWLCPGGGLQEIYFDINNKPVKVSRLDWLKYIILIAIIFIPLISAIRSAGGLTTIDFFLLHRSWNLNCKTWCIHNFLRPNRFLYRICHTGWKARFLSLFLPDCSDNDHRKEDSKSNPLAGSSPVNY
jgi:hypothetical protein